MYPRHSFKALLATAALLGPVPAAHALSSDAVTKVAQAGTTAQSAAKSVAQAAASEVNTAVAAIPGQPASKALDRLDLSRSGATTLEFAAVKMTVPAEGAPSVVGKTALYKSAVASSSVAVQAVDGGMRALVNIASADAPERFEFPFGGKIAGLTLKPDGSVETLNAESEVIGSVQAPWARDANGAVVPTHFEVQGTTLIQVVNHQGGNYAYGITADPLWLAPIAIRACVALRCWQWMPRLVLSAWRVNPYGPVVTGWIRERICPRTRLC
jgi:hypothetical protein